MNPRIVGRDPSCDLVLNDVKCSRRHAVVEAGPHGLAIRDTGSANGVFLNGKKVDRSALKEGDAALVFEAPASLAGKTFGFSLHDALKKGPVVVYRLPAPLRAGTISDPRPGKHHATCPGVSQP